MLLGTPRDEEGAECSCCGHCERNFSCDKLPVGFPDRIYRFDMQTRIDAGHADNGADDREDGKAEGRGEGKFLSPRVLDRPDETTGYEDDYCTNQSTR